jgi:hypothetical protein
LLPNPNLKVVVDGEAAGAAGHEVDPVAMLTVKWVAAPMVGAVGATLPVELHWTVVGRRRALGGGEPNGGAFMDVVLPQNQGTRFWMRIWKCVASLRSGGASAGLTLRTAKTGARQPIVPDTGQVVEGTRRALLHLFFTAGEPDCAVFLGLSRLAS